MARPEVYSNAEKMKSAKKELDLIAAEVAAANRKWDAIAGRIDELSQN